MLKFWNIWQHALYAVYRIYLLRLTFDFMQNCFLKMHDFTSDASSKCGSKHTGIQIGLVYKLMLNQLWGNS